MQTIIALLALVASLPVVLAQGCGGAVYPTLCGYELVNNMHKTQADIAYMVCGRTDTCNGEEWNTMFHMGLGGDWSVDGFCATGCYSENNGCADVANCH